MEASASRLEAIASRLEAIASRLEAIAVGFLLLLGWRPLWRVWWEPSNGSTAQATVATRELACDGVPPSRKAWDRLVGESGDDGLNNQDISRCIYGTFSKIPGQSSSYFETCMLYINNISKRIVFGIKLHTNYIVYTVYNIENVILGLTMPRTGSCRCVFGFPTLWECAYACSCLEGINHCGRCGIMCNIISIE